MSFFLSILQSGSGFVFQTLLTDLLCLGVISYLITTVIVPLLKPIIAFRDVAKQIGGCKGHWICGNVLKYGLNHQGRLNAVERISEFPAMCAHYVGFWGVVLVYHPDVVKKILSGSYPKSFYYVRIFGAEFKDGLVTSSGDVWKRHRRLLTPVFHCEILKEYNKTFNKNRHIFLNACEKFSKTGKTCNVTDAICDMAYFNMMECVMSQTAENNPEMKQLVSEMKWLSRTAMKRAEYSLLGATWMLSFGEAGRRYNKGAALYERIVKKIIKQRQALLASSDFLDNLSEDSVITDEKTGEQLIFRKHKGKKIDFLDILMQAKDENGKGLGNEEIFNEVVTFFGAGQDTTSSAINWVLFNLARHQDYQDRCREEIREVLGQKEECEDSDLPKLVYLTQCIKESMRLYPTIHLISRTLTHDMTFSHEFNNYKTINVPKGTNVSINIFCLHRNPNVWKDPEVYDPERFNPENLKKMSPFAFLPFAAGPRNCIGQRFAMNQIKIVLAHALRSYKFIRDPSLPEPEMVIGVTISPRNGVDVIVERVEE